MHKCGQVWENARKWIPNTLNEKHFGNYSLKGALNLWDESANKKCHSNWPQTYHWKFWNINFESWFKFSRWSCELGIMTKRMVKRQTFNLVIWFQEPLNSRKHMSNDLSIKHLLWTWKRSLQRLQHFILKLLNQSLYVIIMTLQSCKTINLAKSRIFKTLF